MDAFIHKHVPMLSLFNINNHRQKIQIKTLIKENLCIQFTKNFII